MFRYFANRLMLQEGISPDVAAPRAEKQTEELIHKLWPKARIIGAKTP